MENGIREMKYCYIANSGKFKGKPVVWIVVLLQEETLYDNPFRIASRIKIGKQKMAARGVAVCSPLEEPDDNRGYFIARNYALRALKGRETMREITNARAVRTVLKTDCPFTNHLERNPRFTFHEEKALHNVINIKMLPGYEMPETVYRPTCIKVRCEDPESIKINHA